MSFKENNLNNVENNFNADSVKKKENIIKRIMSQPALQRIFLATLLTISTPSSVIKDGSDSKTDIEPKEILNYKQDSLSLDSLSTRDTVSSDSMSEEEYNRGKDVSVPGPIKDPNPFPSRNHNK